MKVFSNTQKLTISALFIAGYIVLMYFTQSFSFMQYQIRIATALYALSAIFPFLILPSGIANFLSNTLFGGLGIFDMLGGLIVGLLTSTSIVLIKKSKLPLYFICFPIILIPGLIVPMYLHILLNLPYWVLAGNILIGQIPPSLLGYFLVVSSKKHLD